MVKWARQSFKSSFSGPRYIIRPLSNVQPLSLKPRAFTDFSGITYWECESQSATYHELVGRVQKYYQRMTGTQKDKTKQNKKIANIYNKMK